MSKRIISFELVILCLISIFFSAPVTYAKENHDEKSHILYEDESKRGMFEKHFVCEDGTYVAASYPEQVCILDKNNEWKLIDNTLYFEKNRYMTSNGNYTISFPETYKKGNYVSLKENDLSLMWYSSLNKNESKDAVAVISDVEKDRSLLDANKIETHINYVDIDKNIDISYVVLPYKIKENIIIKENTDFQGYQMHIKKNGLTAKLTEDNSITFFDATGCEKFYVQTPYMYDNNYEISYDIKIDIKDIEDEYIISIIPSSDWLNSSFISYPVTIDPTVRTSTSKVNFSDTYVYENSTASESRALEERLRVGIYNSKVYRVLWKTSVLPTIPSPYTITGANFVLKFPDATTTSRAFSIYKINSSWNSYTVTWSSANSLSKSLISSNVSRNTSANTLTFSVKGAVKSWYSGTANNGFFIRYTSESTTNPDYNLFYSSDNTTSTSYIPYLLITYTVNTVDGLPLSNYPVGSFFTDNGGACSHSNGDYSACSYTNESACNCKIYDASIQCMGFAKYVYATYTHMSSTNFHNVYTNGTEKANINRNLSGSSTIAKNVLQSLPKGTYVRFNRSSGNGHSVIILSTNSTSITVYECNQNRICDVGTRTITYASVANSYSSIAFTMSHNLSSYSNYNSTYHKILCSNSGCNGYVLEKHKTTGTCQCGYTG